MGVDHDLVVVAGRDLDRTEVDVDDQGAAGLGGAGFVNVFLRSRPLRRARWREAG